MSFVLSEIITHVGAERALSQYHGSLRRAAAAIPNADGFGAGLLTCADELLGELEHGFERDVATPLMSAKIPAQRRVFTVRNLGARAETGMVGLVSNHFTLNPQATAPTVLVIEVSAHVGRTGAKEDSRFGSVDRFGLDSPCCGALDAMLGHTKEGPSGLDWLDQLRMAFGPVRLRVLREMDPAVRLLATAIVHAVLQAEAVVTEFFQTPPPTPTHLIVVSNVAINQAWAPSVLSTSAHHLRCDSDGPTVVEGFSLRSTPEALHIRREGSAVRVEAGELMETTTAQRRRVRAPKETPRAGAQPQPGAQPQLGAPEMTTESGPPPLPHDESLGEAPSHDGPSRDAPPPELSLPASITSKIAETPAMLRARRQLEDVSHNAVLQRTYARPILQALLQGLSVVSPEVGIAQMLVHGVGGVAQANKLQRILEQGPDSPAARQTLHQMEAELQQLNHEEALQVLKILTAETR